MDHQLACTFMKEQVLTKPSIWCISTAEDFVVVRLYLKHYNLAIIGALLNSVQQRDIRKQLHLMEVEFCRQSKAKTPHSMTGQRFLLSIAMELVIRAIERSQLNIEIPVYTLEAQEMLWSIFIT